MFTEMLYILVVKENSNTAITSVTTLWEKPMSARAKVFSAKPIISGTLLLYLETNQPEMGSPSKDPIGMASNMEPSSASLKSKAIFIVGIRDAHVEKLKPERKKNKLRKIRWVFLEIMMQIY